MLACVQVFHTPKRSRVANAKIEREKKTEGHEHTSSRSVAEEGRGHSEQLCLGCRYFRVYSTMAAFS